MIKPDKDLLPDWDEDNINHIAEHGIRPEQVEEVYYRVKKWEDFQKRQEIV